MDILAEGMPEQPRRARYSSSRSAPLRARQSRGERVSPRPSGEVGELADAFNQMAQALEDLIAAASQERKRLVAALNSSIDAVLAVTAEGRITFANVAAERLFLRSHEELVGNPFVWVMADEQVIEALRASREQGRGEARLISRPNRQYLQVMSYCPCSTPVYLGAVPARGGGILRWMPLSRFR